MRMSLAQILPEMLENNVLKFSCLRSS